MPGCRVTVRYAGRAYVGEVECGSTLAEAIAEALGWFILPCGGRGLCGACRVRVLGGRLSRPTEAEERLGLGGGWRLACQARVLGDVEAAVEPAAQRLSVYGVEPPAVEPEPLCRGVAAAVDIGSSKIAAVLFDAETGRNLATGYAVNPQAAWGLDVVSRISRVMREDGLLARMSNATMRAVNGLLRRLSGSAGMPGCAVLTGNAAALPIALGVDPSPLGSYPYENPLTEPLEARGLWARWAETLPAVGGYVGSDAATAATAAMLHGFGGGYLLLDIGVNTEAAHLGEPPLFTSAPAGPAIEGGELSCGATALGGGAVRAYYDGRGFRFYPPGSEERGLSGSAVVTLLASLVEHGLIAEDGRILAADGREGGVAYIELARGLRLTQLDVREFQKAKAAIATAALLLARRAGGLRGLVLAGSLGSGLDVEAAQRIGLLPRAGEAYQYGNLALVGAKMYILSAHARRLHSRILGSAVLVEAMGSREYMEEWMRCLPLRPCPG